MDHIVMALHGRRLQEREWPILGNLTKVCPVFQLHCLWKKSRGIDIIQGNKVFSLVKEEEEGGRKWERG
ncbi:MAG TPA: hypothetical protein VLN47_02000 [Clostridiaceae bacterium]|nr:hypothetical protein [Clostridiaceae bacterium]